MLARNSLTGIAIVLGSVCWPLGAAAVDSVTTDAGGDGSAAGMEPFNLQKRRQDHWVWQPVRDPSPPQVARGGWPRDPLDRFILARLEAAEIEPAPEADRRTWLRRVTFDLTGLPPTPEEIEAFLADESPDCYEIVVERLLASPHFGERWARHWMDLVRYAETYGHEFDYPIPGAWRYRDYLVRAFNADVPYDQLVKEHIAGDLLPEPRRHPTEHFNESVIGTAFWWLGEATHAPTDVRGDEAGRIDNQIDVFSKAFLGLTIACARCHDHKFDAISTDDYYALAGFLQSSRRQLATLDIERSQETLARDAAAIHVRANKLLVQLISPAPSTEELETRFARLLLAAGEADAGPRPDDGVDGRTVDSGTLDRGTLVRWRQALARDALKEIAHPLFILQHVAHDADAAAVADAARQLHSAHAVWNEYDLQSPVFACFDDGTLEAWLPAGWAFGDAPVSAGQWAPGSGPTAIATDGAMHSGRFHGKLHGAVRSPTFTLENETIHYRVSGRGGKIRLVLDGYFMNSYSSLLFKDFELDVDSAGEFTWRVQDGDLHRYRGHLAYIELEDAGDGHIAVNEIRFSNLREGPPPRPSRLAVALADRLSSASRDEVLMEHARALAAAVDAFRTGRVTRDQAKLVEWLLENSLLGDAAASSRSSAEELARLQQEVKRLGNEARPPERIVALTDGTAENERVHIRGNHRTLGEVVPRRLPEALGGAQPAADETGSGRLLLAEHVASTDNPLTARVMVNRIWRHLTGRGIVSTVDNFGAMGSPPTHPELLDHLAMRLANGGWSVKRLIRAIVLSSTYRMASTPTESGQRLDPANHLIHAMRIRRLEGEAIRDAILAVSGRLDPALYGASVPVHLTSFMQGRGRPGESGPLDGDGRRSLYICVRRNFLSPMMLAFDTPIPFTTIGRRNASNVPAQALFLMNDPFVGGEARRWAENLLAQPHESPEHRLRRMYLQALGRPPTPAETQAGFRFCARQAEEYGIDPSAWQVDGRVWADLCHVVLNLKEFILIY